MISLEAIKQIKKGDDQAINEAYMMLTEELRRMKPFDDFSAIREKYDALIEVREDTIEQLNRLSADEFEAMLHEDERNQFFDQLAFVKERHPEADEIDTNDQDA